MKSTLFMLSLLFMLSSSLYGTHFYGKGHYVSKSQLHNVFNRVKKISNVSQKALAKTFSYYENNRYRKHLSPDYLAIADYTKVATTKRLYIVNLHTGNVLKYFLAHGVNSGAKGGRVWRSSNQAGSHMTPYGFFKIGTKEGTTYKKKYKYLEVEGLEWKNRNAKQRDILLHTAWYVETLGRSYGCFSIRTQDRWAVFSRLKRALFYSYTGR